MESDRETVNECSHRGENTGFSIEKTWTSQRERSQHSYHGKDNTQPTGLHRVKVKSLHLDQFFLLVLSFFLEMQKAD